MASVGTVDEFGRENPCSGCPAPCCRAQSHSYEAPERYVDLDQARYRLLAGSSELVRMESGAWYLVRWLDCSLFDGESCTCSVHGTSRQPKVCVHFNAYDCWFRQILVGEARRALRLDLTRFERFVAAVEIDEDGRITSLPSFDETSRLVANLKIRPSFPALPLREATVRRLDTREA